MEFYISEPVINTNCFCRKNKTTGINLQCPHKKKFGDYCGKHKNSSKWRIRIDEPVILNNKVLITKNDYIEDNNLNNFNLKSLKYSCKNYKLKSSNNQEFMISQLKDFFNSIKKYDKFDKQIRLIQKTFKMYLGSRNQILRGPALKNRNLCNNKEDFLTFEYISDIEDKDFFSFSDEDKFIYGFNLNSFRKLIDHTNINPYNRKPIPEKAIKNMKKLIKIEKIEEQQETAHLTAKQKLTQRVMKIFQEIDRLGIYAGGTDINWFNSLNPNKLRLFYKTLEDIWNYRADLTLTQKARIAPYQNMFSVSVSNYYKITSINKMKDVVLGEMEKLVFSAELDSDKTLGCYYILIAFVEINPIVASLMPWLVQY